ncbi:hypothetical protein [Streptomyces canus]|uniref:hypothetical protein n=1 Tax=Streptomyces canus TaxID=58343 RepID=UPI00352EF3FB
MEPLDGVRRSRAKPAERCEGGHVDGSLARLLGFPYFPLTPTFPWLGPLGAVPLPTKWTIQFGIGARTWLPTMRVLAARTTPLRQGGRVDGARC